jgi:hypothetical protein
MRCARSPVAPKITSSFATLSLMAEDRKGNRSSIAAGKAEP